MDRPRDGAADDYLIVHAGSFRLSGNYTVSGKCSKKRKIGSVLLHKDDPVSIRILDGQLRRLLLDR
jgi:hypothetical protein